MKKILNLTINSIKKANLIKFIIASFLFAILAVTIFIMSITWITAIFIEIDTVWLKNFLVALAGIIGTIGGWFMLPSLVMLISGIFQENIIANVEKKYYPNNCREKEPRLFADLHYDIKFILMSLTVNILLLPTYLFGVGIFLGIIANTYLLGREFFENSAGYHIGKKEAYHLGKKHKKTVYINGFIITLASLTPFLNLITPVLATVWMTHIYNRKFLNSKNN